MRIMPMENMQSIREKILQSIYGHLQKEHFRLVERQKKQALSCLTTRFLMREIRNTERM